MVALTLAATLLLQPAPVWAYVGPGAGFALVSSLFALLITFVLAALAVLSWPVRAAIRAIRYRTPQWSLAFCWSAGR